MIKPPSILERLLNLYSKRGFKKFKKFVVPFECIFRGKLYQKLGDFQSIKELLNQFNNLIRKRARNLKFNNILDKIN